MNHDGCSQMFLVPRDPLGRIMNPRIVASQGSVTHVTSASLTSPTVHSECMPRQQEEPSPLNSLHLPTGSFQKGTTKSSENVSENMRNGPSPIETRRQHSPLT